MAPRGALTCLVHARRVHMIYALFEQKKGGEGGKYACNVKIKEVLTPSQPPTKPLRCKFSEHTMRRKGCTYILSPSILGSILIHGHACPNSD